jgi:Fungal specific transcription factor domain
MGLHTHLPELPPLAAEQRQARLRTFITILKLDVYSSLVLGLPPFIDLSRLDHDLVICETDIPPYRVSPSGVDSENSFKMELSLKHFEVLKITTLGLKSVFSQNKSSSEVDSTNVDFPVNIKQLEYVEEQFQMWARNCSSDFRRVGDVADYDM